MDQRHVYEARPTWNILYWALVIPGGGNNLDFIRALCERDDIDFTLPLGSRERTALQFAQEHGMSELVQSYISNAMRRQMIRQAAAPAVYSTVATLSESSPACAAAAAPSPS